MTNTNQMATCNVQGVTVRNFNSTNAIHGFLAGSAVRVLGRYVNGVVVSIAGFRYYISFVTGNMAHISAYTWFNM